MEHESYVVSTWKPLKNRIETPANKCKNKSQNSAIKTGFSCLISNYLVYGFRLKYIPLKCRPLFSSNTRKMSDKTPQSKLHPGKDAKDNLSSPPLASRLETKTLELNGVLDFSKSQTTPKCSGTNTCGVETPKKRPPTPFLIENQDQKEKSCPENKGKYMWNTFENDEEDTRLMIDDQSLSENDDDCGNRFEILETIQSKGRKRLFEDDGNEKDLEPASKGISVEDCLKTKYSELVEKTDELKPVCAGFEQETARNCLEQLSCLETLLHYGTSKANDRQGLLNIAIKQYKAVEMLIQSNCKEAVVNTAIVSCLEKTKSLCEKTLEVFRSKSVVDSDSKEKTPIKFKPINFYPLTSETHDLLDLPEENEGDEEAIKVRVCSIRGCNFIQRVTSGNAFKAHYDKYHDSTELLQGITVGKYQGRYVKDLETLKMYQNLWQRKRIRTPLSRRAIKRRRLTSFPSDDASSADSH